MAKTKYKKTVVRVADLTDLANPPNFESELDLTNDLPQYDPDTLLRTDIHTHLVSIHNIDEYKYNPRKVDNESFQELKDSIEANGLLSPPALMQNPATRRFELFNGGNTRLRALKQLYSENNGARKFEFASFTVHPWLDDDATKIVQHLIENEVRGKLYHVDKAKTIANLEAIFKEQITKQKTQESKSSVLAKSDTKTASGKALKAKKDSEESSESLRAENYGTTTKFLDYLQGKGYSNVSEQALSSCRFTNRYLVGVIDYHLTQGIGTPKINQLRHVYNNLKRYIKDKELDDFQEKQLETLFKQSLGKYNNFKQPYDYYKLIDVLALELLKTYPFKELFGDDKEAIIKMMMLKKVKKIKPEAEVSSQKDETGSSSEDGNENTGAELESDNKNDDDPKLGATSEILDSTESGSNKLHDKTTAGGESQLVKSSLEGAADKLLADDKNKSAGMDQHTHEVDASNDIDTLRQQAFEIVNDLVESFEMNIKIDQINTGCGYLVKTAPQSSRSDLWCLFYLMLDNSMATDPTNLVKNKSIINLDDGADKNNNLLGLYLAKDGQSYEDAFYDLVDGSGVVTPLPGVIGGFKRSINRSQWQKLSQLEFVAFQIIGACANQGKEIWS